MNALIPIDEVEEVDPYKDLNFQQELFVRAYMVNGGNAYDAAREAGYSSPENQSYRIVSTPRVKAAIEYLRAQRTAAFDLALRDKHFSKDKVLADLCEMAGFDLSEVLNGNGVIDRSKIKAHAKQLQSVEIDGPKTKIKGPDRMAAYRLLADLMGWTASKQTVAVQVNVDFGERMAKRRAKALEDR